MKLNDASITTFRRQYAGCLLAPGHLAQSPLVIGGLAAFVDYSQIEPTANLTSCVLALPFEGAICQFVLVRATAPLNTRLETAVLHIAEADEAGSKVYSVPHGTIYLREAFAKLSTTGAMKMDSRTFMTPTAVIPIQALRSPEAYDAYLRGKAA